MLTQGATNNSIGLQLLRAGGKRTFNIRRTANKRRKIAGAVELEWLVETGLGVRMWDLNGRARKHVLLQQTNVDFQVRVSGKLDSAKWNR